MAEQVNVIVDEAYMDRFDEVVERAQAAGLRVEHVLPEIGVVSGSVEPTRRHELERRSWADH